jgi:hypothetical protein
LGATAKSGYVLGEALRLGLGQISFGFGLNFPASALFFSFWANASKFPSFYMFGSFYCNIPRIIIDSA